MSSDIRFSLVYKGTHEIFCPVAVLYDLAKYPQMPLNDAKIRNLKTKEKSYKVGDFDGLFLLVKATGSKSWRFKYRIEGKEKLLVIGDYPAISLLQARQARVAVSYL